MSGSSAPIPVIWRPTICRLRDAISRSATRPNRSTKHVAALYQRHGAGDVLVMIEMKRKPRAERRRQPHTRGAASPRNEKGTLLQINVKEATTVGDANQPQIHPEEIVDRHI